MHKEATENILKRGKEFAENMIDAGSSRVDSIIEGKMKNMLAMVAGKKESLDKFAGINEEEILRYVPDKRNFSGVSTLLLGIFFLVILSGWWTIISFILFGWSIVLFGLFYVNNAKVDVPDGFKGVACRWGKSDDSIKSSVGRNWMLHYSEFIPYIVSLRDMVVDSVNANFTSDYITISIGDQIVFRVVRPDVFINNTTPAGIMKILSLYMQYISLRIIMSIEDSRVKFVGRDDLKNVAAALNRYLLERYGIEVIRVTMPNTTNGILTDLEGVRTDLKQINALKENKVVKLEAAIKEVESTIRKSKKQSRSKAIELRQEAVTLETSIAEAVNTQIQENLIRARRELEEKFTELKRAIATIKAKAAKAEALKNSIDGLKTRFDLEISAIKRKIYLRLMPENIEVLDVEGIGPGFGMSIGNQMLARMLPKQKNGTNAIPGEGASASVSTQSTADTVDGDHAK